MKAKIINTDSQSVTIEVTIPLTEDMLSSEEAIQQGVNQSGLLATQYALSRYDTDGSPVEVGEKKYTGKGQHSKTYQCPFGEFELCRHVYQSNEGGSRYCPLDNDARVLCVFDAKICQNGKSKIRSVRLKACSTRFKRESWPVYIAHLYPKYKQFGR